MTFREVYNKGKDLLRGNIEDYEFEAMYIFEYVFKADKQFLIINGGKNADCNLCKKYFDYIEQRKSKIPLQYILGEWEFYGKSFLVGEGVLIPREDTRVVVDECLKRINFVKNPKVIDLCCGCGTIAVILADKRPDGTFYGMELSDKAYSFLAKNKELNASQNVNIIQDNVLKPIIKFDYEYFDAIVSNPPYISTDVIPTLQREVRQEPVLALDGGIDGLNFYRGIVSVWTKYLKIGGSISFEIGEEQAEDVSNILLNNGYTDINVLKDIADLDRAVSAIRYK